MVRTRVGYAGGSKPDPTYYDPGGHAETLEVDFNPALVSLEELLRVFWAEHNPCRRPWSRQYLSALFYHDAQERGVMQRSLDAEEARRGRQIHTELIPLDRFHLAEDYHQKYFLQKDRALTAELEARAGGFWEMVDSTAAARVNAILGGETIQESLEELQITLPRAALSRRRLGSFW